VTTGMHAIGIGDAGSVYPDQMSMKEEINSILREILG